MKKGLLIILFSAFYCNSFGVIQNEIDSIKQVIKTEKIDTILLKAYLKISGIYAQENNDSALAYAKKSYQLASSIHHKKGETISLCRMGLIYFNLGNLSNALQHYNQSLAIAKSIDYQLYIAQNYKLIGALYGYEKEYRNALNYQYKSLAIFQNERDTLNIARTYDNIAVYYRRLTITDSSMQYLNLAIAINKPYKNFRSLSFNYNNMASLFMMEEEFEKAEIYYLKSLTLRKKYGLKQDLLQSYNNIGNLFYNTEKYTQSIPYFHTCVSISNEIKIIKHLPLFYDNLYSCYYELGNYKLALEQKKRQHLYADSINSIGTQTLIANEEQEIKNSEETYQKLLLETDITDIEKIIFKRSILIAILLLITFIAVYIVFQSIKNYQLQESLAKQKTSLLEIQENEKILIVKENAAQKINTAQEILTTEIANLLHKEVTIKLNKVRTELDTYKLNNPKAETIVNKEQKNITDAIHFIDSISTNLLPPILEELALTDAINKYLNTIFSSTKMQVNFTHTNPEIINTMEKDLSHNIYRIIQELITNSVKYAKATEINIEISNSPDHLLLRVQDDGIGFNPNNKRMGLGLNNVKQRTLLYNGEMIVNTKIGAGTEILINMNYKKG